MIKDYDFIVPKIDDECPDGYEEMTFEEFFELSKATENEIKSFINKHFAVNLHWAYHSRNYTKITELVEDIKNDPRLSKLNAIVFLALKQKGRGIGFTPLPFHKFKEMVEYVMESGITYGFDSCTANNFLKSVEDHPNYEQFKIMSEACEAVCFSSYIDVHGDFYPCSFCERITGWEEGLSVVNCENFLQDIWNHPKTNDFRESLLVNGRSCPVYNI